MSEQSSGRGVEKTLWIVLVLMLFTVASFLICDLTLLQMDGTLFRKVEVTIIYPVGT